MSNIIDITELSNIVRQASGGENFATFENWDALKKSVETQKIRPYGGSNISPKNSIFDITKKITPSSDTKTSITANASQYSNITSGLSGGKSTVSIVNNAKTNATGAVTLTSLGVSASIPLSYAIAGVLAGCGIGILSYDLNPEFWTDVSNSIFTKIGLDPINYEEIQNYRITTLLAEKAGEVVNFIDENLLNIIYESLIENNAFLTTISPELLSKNTDPQITNVSKSILNYFAEKIEYSDGVTRAKKAIDLAFSNSDFINFISDTSSYYYVTVFGGAYSYQNGYVQFYKVRDFLTWFKDDNTIITNKSDTEQEISNSRGGLIFDSFFVMHSTGEYSQNDRDTPVSFVLFNAPELERQKAWAYTSLLANFNDNPMPGLEKIGDIPDISKNLPENFPTWIGDFPVSATNPELAPAADTNYVPLAVPALDPLINPTNLTQPDAQQGLVSTFPDLSIESVNENIPQDPVPTPTGTGGVFGGTTPTSASGLFKIYNPTEAQVSQFASWLWSPNFVDQILKLYSDPMQAIIGFHQIYKKPITGGTTTIKCGYLDSNVSSDYVSNQYLTINCGNINVNEFYGNVNDYSPRAEVELFLPFLGIVSINVNDIMASILNVVANVDVLTGAILYEVNIIRNGISQCLYTFNSNCAVQLPLSSGSYASILTSIISAGIGIAGTYFSGGMLAPTLLGSANSLLNSGTNVKTNGSIGSNTGAMGAKKPYLIIKYKIPYTASNFEKFEGFPENKTIKISQVTGYTKFKSVHLDSIKCTDAEKDEIERMLLSGVIF